MHDEAEILADRGQILLLDTAEIALIAEEELERGRHHHIISERAAHQEQHWRRDQEGQESPLLLGLKARRDERPDLVGDDREGEKEGGEEGHPNLDEEGLIEIGIDELRSDEHTSELQSLMRISYA